MWSQLFLFWAFRAQDRTMLLYWRNKESRSLLRFLSMTTQKRLTKKKIQTTIDDAWSEMLHKVGFSYTQEQINQVLRDGNVPAHTRVASGLRFGMVLGLGGFGKRLSREIRTEEQLNKFLLTVKELEHALPTLVRKATKEVVSTLPRGGGPGRAPKLNAKESNLVCDQISLFIRKKHSLKEALSKVSELTPVLLGKKVSARTLQKAWDRRDEFTG